MFEWMLQKHALAGSFFMCMHTYVCLQRIYLYRHMYMYMYVYARTAVVYVKLHSGSNPIWVIMHR